MSETRISAPDQEDYQALRTWFEENRSELPEKISRSLEAVIALYQSLSLEKEKSRDILRSMRLAMGLIPKSEKGSLLTKQHRGIWE